MLWAGTPPAGAGCSGHLTEPAASGEPRGLGSHRRLTQSPVPACCCLPPHKPSRTPFPVGSWPSWAPSWAKPSCPCLLTLHISEQKWEKQTNKKRPAGTGHHPTPAPAPFLSGAAVRAPYLLPPRGGGWRPLAAVGGGWRPLGLGAGPRRCLRTDSSAAAGRRRGEQRRGEEERRGLGAPRLRRRIGDGRRRARGRAGKWRGAAVPAPGRGGGKRGRGLEEAAQGEGGAAGEDRLGARAAVWHRPAPCGTDRPPVVPPDPPCGTGPSLRAAVRAPRRPGDRAGGEIVSSSALLLRRFVSPKAPL